MTFKTFEQVTKCPHCGALHECVSNAQGERPPSPGDVTLCFDCGEWCVFDDKLELAKPDDGLMIEIGSNPECYMIRASWLAFNADRKVEKGSTTEGVRNAQETSR